MLLLLSTVFTLWPLLGAAQPLQVDRDFLIAGAATAEQAPLRACSAEALARMRPAIEIAAPEGGWSDEIGAIQMKLLEITSRVGKLSGTAVEAIADSTITNAEAEQMIAEIRALRTMANRLERNVARAAAKGRAAR